MRDAGVPVGMGVDGSASNDSSNMLAEAVSYTHLRAHETVLDLACRLLLVKKTTIFPSHMAPADPSFSN